MSHRFWSAPLLAATAAAGLIACGGRTTPSQEPTPAPSERLIREREAEAQRSREEARAFTDRLQQQFQQEQRDPNWAGQFERRLADAFANDTTNLPGTLQEVQCRASKCLVTFSVSPNAVPETAQAALVARLSAVQPCGYFVPGPGVVQAGASEQRVFLDCEREMGR